MQTTQRITNQEVETVMAFFETNLPRHSAFAAPRRGGALFTFAMRAVEVRRQRNALKRLTDADLRDIGLTRSQVDNELSKPFWDVPATWRH